MGGIFSTKQYVRCIGCDKWHAVIGQHRISLCTACKLIDYPRCPRCGSRYPCVGCVQHIINQAVYTGDAQQLLNINRRLAANVLSITYRREYYLHVCAMGYLDALKWLMKNDYLTFSFVTLVKGLTYACHNNRANIVRWLLPRVDMDDGVRHKCLMHACAQGHVNIAQILLKQSNISRWVLTGAECRHISKMNPIAAQWLRVTHNMGTLPLVWNAKRHWTWLELLAIPACVHLSAYTIRDVLRRHTRL